MTRIADEIKELETEITKHESRLKVLEQPNAKPIAAGFTDPKGLLTAQRDYQEAERDRKDEIEAICAILPILKERLEEKQSEAKAFQAIADQDWEKIKILAEKARQTAQAHHDAFKELVEFSRQKSSQGHLKLYSRPLLQLYTSNGGTDGLKTTKVEFREDLHLVFYQEDAQYL
jgi:DNA repair exonuclease SbcCD ATPase subunit